LVSNQDSGGGVLGGVLELLLIPAIHSLVQSTVPDPALMAVVASVVQALTRDLAILCLLLIFAGVVILGIERHYFNEEDQKQPSPVT
jgi:hypothetical protein